MISLYSPKSKMLQSNIMNNKEEKIPIKEILYLENIGNEALTAAMNKQLELGDRGLENLEKNQFGDTALSADVESEIAVLDVLKKHGLSITVISEEHGTTVIGNGLEYLGILDGLDGSSVFKRTKRKGRYGTMFAIYKGNNPRYKDYIYGGIIEQAKQKIFYTTRDNGAHTRQQGNTKKIKVAEEQSLNNVTKIYADTNYDTVFNVDILTTKIARLESLSIECLGSSAMHYADLASGKVDVVIECTRKGNLEIAVAYALVSQAGGVMLDINGNYLTNERYFEFGQDQNVIVISAANEALAREVITRLTQD